MQLLFAKNHHEFTLKHSLMIDDCLQFFIIHMQNNVLPKKTRRNSHVMSKHTVQLKWLELEARSNQQGRDELSNG